MEQIFWQQLSFFFTATIFGIPTIIDIAGFTRISEHSIQNVLELSQLQIVDWFAMKEYNQDKRPFLHLYVEMSPQSLVSQAVTREILREHLSVYFKYVDQDYKDLKRKNFRQKGASTFTNS